MKLIPPVPQEFQKPNLWGFCEPLRKNSNETIESVTVINSQINSLSGDVIALENGYSSITNISASAGTTTLTDTDVEIIVSGSTTHTIYLPTVTAGKEIEFVNNSTGDVTISGGVNIDDSTSIKLARNQGTSLIKGSNKWYAKGSKHFVNLLWDDLRVGPSLRTTGATQPTLDVYRNNVRLWKFNGNDEMFFETQIPHRYSPETDLRPHIHWTHNLAVNSGVVTWNLEYIIAAVEGTNGASTVISTTSQNILGTERYKHNIVSFPTIVGTGLGVSSIMMGRIYRSADAGSGDVFLEAFDIHFQCFSEGTVNEMSYP